MERVSQQRQPAVKDYNICYQTSSQPSLVQALQLQLLVYGAKCIFKFLLIGNQFQVNGAELMVVFPSEESRAATHRGASGLLAVPIGSYFCSPWHKLVCRVPSCPWCW